MTECTENRWELRGPEGILGHLCQYDHDFPWVSCTIEATEAFERYRPLFLDGLQLIEKEDWEGFDRLQEQIEAYSLRLIDARTGETINDFLLHIEEEKAWFRS
jgi:hypothetical protein